MVRWREEVHGPTSGAMRRVFKIHNGTRVLGLVRQVILPGLLYVTVARTSSTERVKCIKGAFVSEDRALKRGLTVRSTATRPVVGGWHALRVDAGEQNSRSV